MTEVTEMPIPPQKVIDKVKSDSSGCVVTYIGLIRNYSQGRAVLSVEYQDYEGNAKSVLQEIVTEAKRKWHVENVAISHRTSKLMVGEINLVVAVASAHRREAFAACRYIIDQFKQRLPTRKVETYQDSSINVEEAVQQTQE